MRYGWMPVEEEQQPAEAPHLGEAIAGWRLHVHGVMAEGLPERRAGSEKGKAWAQLYFKLTALWSHESLTSAPFAPGEPSHTLDEQTFTLALPNTNPPKEGAGAGEPRVPLAELRLQLCAKIPGHADEVVGADTCTLATRSGVVEQLVLRGPIWMGQMARASFSYEIEGLTPEQVEGEWSEAAAPAPPRAGAVPERPSTAVGVLRLGKTSIGHSAPATPQLNVVEVKKKGVFQPRKEAETAARPKLHLGFHTPAPTTADGAAPTTADGARNYAFGSTLQGSNPTSPATRPETVQRAPGVPPPKPPVVVPSVEESSKRLLARPTSAPSARLLLQLEECARIKAAFNKAGLMCPMQAIERGLLLPEDRPQAGMRLPGPGSRLVDPFYVPPKPKKGKRKKKRSGSAKRR